MDDNYNHIQIGVDKKVQEMHGCTFKKRMFYRAI